MRRNLFAVPLLLVSFLCAPLIAQTGTHTTPPPYGPADGPAVPPAPAETPTPEMFWHALETGNAQYVAGRLTYDHLKEDRKAVADAQFPPITVLTCSDSRVPTELVFNQSVGGVFVIRTAGNVADTYGLASIEYAIAHDWTMLLVVLAHENCGAVKAALDQNDPATPSLLALVQRIRGSFYGIAWDPENKEAVYKATIANARAAAASLVGQSAVIRKAVADGKVKVVIAYYSTKTGEVKRVE